MTSIQFTALIRLPFARGDFVDPQQATWDSSKDRELWRHVSKSSKTKDLDWVRLASGFNVPPAFLLQQAAWLYERHLDHVRAQMKKVGGQTAPASSGIDNGAAKAGASAMNRRSIGPSGASKPPSMIIMRQKDDQVARETSGAPAPPASQPTLSRTPSTNTITQSRALGQYASGLRPRQKEDVPRASHLDLGQRVSQKPLRTPGNDSPTDPTSSASSSSLSNSGRDNIATRSQLFKRPPRFKAQSSRELLTYEEDVYDPEEVHQNVNTEFPFANISQPRQPQANEGGLNRQSPAFKERHDRMSTVRRNNRPVNIDTNAVRPASALETSSSMTSSTNEPTNSGIRDADPSLPKYRAEMARVSPRRNGPKARKEGSEGTPSMGSSFSDIDDTSISQSALEEALLSNIQHGRMSTLSQLRSRYL